MRTLTANRSRIISDWAAYDAHGALRERGFV